MSNTTKRLVLATSIALATLCTGNTLAAGVESREVSDARQETQIWTTFALNPYLRASDLQVLVRNGKATLTGSVEAEVDKELAKRIALSVSGVKEVDNLIMVQTDYVPPAQSAQRSWGELIDDATITAAIKSKLLWSNYSTGLTTEVDTQQGIVSLVGTADTLAAKDLANSLATHTRGVVNVNNQLIVNQLVIPEEPGATIAAKPDLVGTEPSFSDGWITAKVKSIFIYSTQVENSRIAVSTHEGVVTLGGKLNSSSERDLAIDLARHIRGVKWVEATGLTHY